MSKDPHANRKKGGYTLTEVAVSSFILLMAVTVSLSGYLFSIKNTHQADTQNALDMTVQLAIERIKQDLRLSSMSLVRYYPSKPPYTAISFPVAYDLDGDGMLERDNKMIIWNETVIYHIRDGTPSELVRTTFSPRDNTMDGPTRFQQLSNVVKNGGDDDAISRVIFQNLLNWEFNPREGRYNGYDEVHTFDGNVFLGYALLENGDHEVTFEVVEAGEEGGFSVGVDQVYASTASTAREGETLTAKNQEGASPKIYLDRQAKGNHQLMFPATGVGNKFTVTVHNDKWVETNFENNEGTEDVNIVFDETIVPKDIVVQLAGMEPAWKAALQTESLYYVTPSTELKGTVIRQLQKGDSILNGGFIQSEGLRSRLVFRASDTQAFRIKNVYFGQSASAESIDMGYKSTPVRLNLVNTSGTESSAFTIPAGHSVTSSWADIEISSTNNYLVTYSIASNVNRDSPAAWPEAHTNSPSTTRLAYIGGGASYSEDALAAEPGNWDDISDPGLTIYAPPYAIGLEQIQVCYAPTGTYTSRILDTTLDSPSFESIRANVDLPSGTAFNFKVRTGDTHNLSDAEDWDAIDASLLVKAANKRYIQFQAILEADGNLLKTPKLKDVTLDWAGETRLVNIGGRFSKGPDHGVFEISVDGKKLTSALVVDMEIYKDIRAMGGEMRRISSSQKVEISPRNTGF